MTLAEAIEARGCSGCDAFGSPWRHLSTCPIQIAADLRSGKLGQDTEPREQVSVLADGPNKELWAMIAMKGQYLVRMTPKHFPFMANWEETVDRANLYPKLNSDFRRRWTGYKLVGCRVDGEVEI